MPRPKARLRPPPADRLAGNEHLLDVPGALRALRAEPQRTGDGHRQITILHQPPLRLVLFAFDAGGRIKEHAAPGWITIHALRGTIAVRTRSAQHQLTEGKLLTLGPGVLHDVEATGEADMLLTVTLDASSDE